ncbi:MAG: aminotransferase class I/II-fold pyridoxal phosphate-dependent enzyme [Caldilineaceae bacterium]
MRERINTMRHLFVETLNERAWTGTSAYARQRGMFSFSGLNPEQVGALRDRYAIYIVGSGRINVAGMTQRIWTICALRLRMCCRGRGAELRIKE